MIEGKVAALKNTLEKFAEVEKKMTEMVNTKGNAIQLKKTYRQSFIQESFKDQMAEINEHAIKNEQYSRKSSVRHFGIPA